MNQKLHLIPKTKNHFFEKPKSNLPNYPCRKQNIWVENTLGYYCPGCEIIINKQNHQIDEKVLRQNRYFSTRLPYANKKSREIFLLWLKLNTTQQQIDKIQQLKGKT